MFCFLNFGIRALRYIFQHGALSSTHPINQHPSYDRYAEMTSFVNNTTTKSKSKYSISNIRYVEIYISHFPLLMSFIRICKNMKPKMLKI